ncbi:MAG: glutathione S-transferase N-terminal domain-containing protein [Acidiferrobacterales bacterium]
MTTLYHFWWSPESQRIRLALGYKEIVWDDRPLAFDDDETFFNLGMGRQVPVLQLDDGTLITDSLSILGKLDQYWPCNPIFGGVIPPDVWQEFRAWRKSADALISRLHAPVLPAYRGIGDSDRTLAAYKSEVARRFGAGVEELANDRYAAFAQLVKQTRLKELATLVTRNRFYMEVPSAADMVLAADLFPLQLLDGVTLPIDLLYYIERVENTCHTSLRNGLIDAM